MKLIRKATSIPYTLASPASGGQMLCQKEYRSRKEHVPALAYLMTKLTYVNY